MCVTSYVYLYATARPPSRRHPWTGPGSTTQPSPLVRSIAGGLRAVAKTKRQHTGPRARAVLPSPLGPCARSLAGRG